MVAFVWIGQAFGASAAERVLQTEANVMVELTLTSSRTYANPFNDVTLDVTFTDPAGHQLRVPAFWAGTQLWKVRYASPVAGTHRFRTECSESQDKGLHDITGQVKVKPYQGTNPLYTHGPLRVTASRRYLEHADGTPFFWLGDTWWMGLCHRLHWPEEFKKLTADRKEKGFTVIQLVAGLYPDMPPFDARGANEAGFPWKTNYTQIRPEYFDLADRRIRHLVDQGLTPCIVGAWGYFIPLMGVEKAKQHWRNLVARYGALPVVWCVAGEANLPYYLAKGFPYDDRVQVKDWTEVTRYLRATDPFHRLITIHPTGINRLSARNATDDIALLDIDMLQTPHGQREAVAPTVRTVRESYADQPVLPVINGEASYEMLMDKIPAQWPREMFWVCMMNGAAGHTYGANGIWQCNRPGQPHGPSPNGGTGGVGYGAITWEEAMNLPGSRQISYGKKLLMQFPWHLFTPHPEWARWGSKPPQPTFGDWIWYPEGDPKRHAPVEARFFRRTFEVPGGRAVKQATLYVGADDLFRAWVNGREIGSGGAWNPPARFDVTRDLRSGRNVLAVRGENAPAPVKENPAGLIAVLEIELTDGTSFTVRSGADWRVAKTVPAEWSQVEFNDSAWVAAMVTAHPGEAPWGKLDQAQEDLLFVPYASGIPDLVRVIYAPEGRAVIVSGLKPGSQHRVTNFDPVSGEQRVMGSIQANEKGEWTAAAPAHGHDWVVILEAANVK